MNSVKDTFIDMVKHSIKTSNKLTELERFFEPMNRFSMHKGFFDDATEAKKKFDNAVKALQDFTFREDLN